MLFSKSLSLLQIDPCSCCLSADGPGFRILYGARFLLTAKTCKYHIAYSVNTLVMPLAVGSSYNVLHVQ